MKPFFFEALSTLRTSGTIAPSSKFLIQDCLKDLDLEHAKVILEFGAGDGCFTEAILERIPADCTLYSFELNPAFYEHCREKFKNHSNFKLYQGSAADFTEVLAQHNIRQVDAIVSSLPLTLLSDEELEFLKDVPQYLHKRGSFVQYQYSPMRYAMFKKIFSRVELGFTFRNIPPAVIYKCTV
jgi:phospholipid N-methyltransferase